LIDRSPARGISGNRCCGLGAQPADIRGNLGRLAFAQEKTWHAGAWYSILEKIGEGRVIRRVAEAGHVQCGAAAPLAVNAVAWRALAFEDAPARQQVCGRRRRRCLG
jgi:hypothetical protein